MAISSVGVSVGTTPAVIAAAVTGGDNLEYRITNYGANTLYLSSNGTTAGASWPVSGGSTFGFVLQFPESMYGAAASGTCDVRVLAASQLNIKRF